MASEFREDELITGRERGAIVRTAARSDVAATPASVGGTINGDPVASEP